MRKTVQKPKKQPRKNRALSGPPAETPAVTLTGNKIVFSGMAWQPAQGILEKLISLGAFGIRAATPEVPGVVEFANAVVARAAFESMFNTSTDEWGLDETLPDETQWKDEAGMDDLAKQVAQGVGG